MPGERKQVLPDYQPSECAASLVGLWTRLGIVLKVKKVIVIALAAVLAVMAAADGTVAHAATGDLVVRAETFNILTNVTKTVGTTPTELLPWAVRRQAVVDWVHADNPDVIGFQENYPLPSGKLQLTDIDDELLPDYTFLMNRDVTIAFKAAKYTLVSSGVVPIAKPSGFKDADASRSLQWAKLTDKASGRQFLAFATHTAPYQSEPYQLTRQLQIDAVIAAIQNLNPGYSLPFFLMGDFNAFSTETKPIWNAQLADTAAAGLVDTASITAKNATVPSNAASYTGITRSVSGQDVYGAINTSNYHYDYIFVPKGAQVSSWRIQTGPGLRQVLVGTKTVYVSVPDGGIVPSDHDPVVADIVFPSGDLPAPPAAVTGGAITLNKLNVGISSGSTTAGAAAQLQSADGSPAQAFSIIVDASGWGTIRNIGSGMCLAVPSGSAVAGTPVSQQPCAGTDAQKWFVWPNGDGTYSLFAKLAANLALDVAGATAVAAAGLQLASFTGAATQRFGLPLLTLPNQSMTPAGQTIVRLAGADAIGTALAISRSGWTSSPDVVLASGNNFPDAMAGGPLAYKLGAPILLTSNKTTGIEPAVMAELNRLGAKTVWILGLNLAVNAKIASQIAASGRQVKRLGGTTQYDTAVAIARAVAPANAPGVVITTGKNFPDALSIVPPASRLGMPILYVQPGRSLTKVVTDYLKQAKPAVAYVAGGTAVVSNTAQNQAKALTTGVSAIRLGGADLYGTNVAINDYFMRATMPNGTPVLAKNPIAIATGTNFPDALAGGQIAARKSAPLFLLNGRATTANPLIRAAISATGFQTAYVFGGLLAVTGKSLILHIT